MRKERNLRSDLEQNGWMKVGELYLLKEDLQDAKLDKATFKKAMQIFANEFNNYFIISGVKIAGFIDDDLGKVAKKQMKEDWDNFVDFIDSRLDDEVLDNMVKDGTLKE